MKALINKKVWDLPNATMETITSRINRDVNGTPLNVPLRNYEITILIPYTCCNKSLLKYLDKQFNKRKTFNFVVLMGTTQEAHCKLFIDGFKKDDKSIHTFHCTVYGEVVIKELINWDEVENEI